MLFANIELYTNIVVAHRDEIGEDYLVPLVGPDLAARLMNKTDFYATCAELGVPHPESVIVSPGPLDGIGDELPFPYPVILKPSNTDIYPRLHFEGQQKVYLVEDAASLREIAARIFAAGTTTTSSSRSTSRATSRSCASSTRTPTGTDACASSRRARSS